MKPNTVLGVLSLGFSLLFAAEPASLIHVKRDVLPQLLQQEQRRVLMPAEEYRKLLARAEAENAAPRPTTSAALRVDYRLFLADDHVDVESVVLLEGIGPGLHHAHLHTKDIFWSEAKIDGADAELGGKNGDLITVFFEGEGRRELRLKGQKRLERLSHAQDLVLNLPQLPGDIRLVTDAGTPVTENERELPKVLLPGGNLAETALFAAGGNLRVRFRQSRFATSSPQERSGLHILHSVLSASQEELLWESRIHIAHQPLRELDIAIPADLLLRQFESDRPADWRVLEQEGQRLLRIRFAEDMIGPLRIHLQGQRPFQEDKPWSPPQVKLLGSAWEEQLNLLSVAAPLRILRSETQALREVDTTAAFSLMKTEAGSGYTHLAWISEGQGAAMTLQLERPDVSVGGVVNLLLRIGADALELEGGVVLLPRGAELFSSSFVLPAFWRVESVTSDDGTALTFETVPVDDGSLVTRVQFSRPAPADQPVSFRFVARHTPDDWFANPELRRVTFPAFLLRDIREFSGAIAVEPVPEHQLRTVVLEGLTPLDDREKVRFGFQNSAQTPAYRFEEEDHRLTVELEKLQSEIRVQSFSLFEINPSAVNVHYEWVLDTRRARAKRFVFFLPVVLPASVLPRGLSGTEVGEVVRRPSGSGEEWTLTLSGNTLAGAALALTAELPQIGNEPFVLPLPEARNADIQSGFFSVEGSPELEVTMLGSPKEVDVGELTAAQKQPGPRLLGAYAFTGLPPKVELRVQRQALADIREAILRKVTLTTRLSANGRAQTQAEFHAKNLPAFVALRLPADSVCWAVEVDGLSVEPRQGSSGEFLVPIPVGAVQATRVIHVVYESTLPPLKQNQRVAMKAPSLALPARGADVAGGELLPVETFWTLEPPEGFVLGHSRGSAAPRNTFHESPAVLDFIRFIVQLGGGIRDPDAWLNNLGGLTLRSTGSDRIRGMMGGATEELGGDAGSASSTSSVEIMQGIDYEFATGMPETPQNDLSNLFSNVPVDADVQKEIKQEKGKPKGYRSLKINLDSEDSGSGFYSLAEQSELDLRLVTRSTLGTLAFAVGCLVFAGGLLLYKRTLRVRLGYAFAAMLLSALPGFFPSTLVWIPVGDAAFNAAWLLLFLYLGIGFVRIVATPLRHRILQAALLLGAWTARSDDKAPPLPLPIPAEAVVRILDGEGVESWLLPLDHVKALEDKIRNLEAPVVEAGPGLTWMGGRAELRLDDQETLSLVAVYRVRVRGAGLQTLPLPASSAQMTRVRLNGQPAPLHRRGETTEIWLQGEGSHTLSLEMRVPVRRQELRWEIDTHLLPAPALIIALRLPRAGTEVSFDKAAVIPRFTSRVENEELLLPVAANGRLRLEWRSADKNRPMTEGLQVTSDIFFETRPALSVLRWNLDLQNPGRPLKEVDLQVSKGWSVHSVLGTDVGGWEWLPATDAPEAEETATLRVHFRREIEGRVAFNLELWRKADADVAGAPRRESLPILRVAEALRHTGTLQVFRAPQQQMQVRNSEGLRRIDVDAQTLAKTAVVMPGLLDAPVFFQGYSFHSPGHRLDLDLAGLPSKHSATWERIFRLAEREQMLEALCRIQISGTPLHQLEFSLPEGMEIESVMTPPESSWSADAAVLRIFSGTGLIGDVQVLIQGRFKRDAGDQPMALPRLDLRGAETQKGQWAILSDPAFDVDVRDLQNVEPLLLRQTHTWLKAPQHPFARLALAFSQSEHDARLLLRKRLPDISVTSFTNLRINHRIIEETLLLEARVQHAGLRTLQVEIPERFADAEVKAPLLRDVKMTPIPDAPGWLEMTIELQDEIMGQIVILLEKDRSLDAGPLVVQPPRIVTGRAERAFVTIENAGRDEIHVSAAQRLEALTREHAEWAQATRVLKGGATFAYVGRGNQRDASLTLQITEREQAVTSGARIGLARAELVLDESGAYRGRWNAWLDNRSEAFLHLEMPEGAQVLGVSVAGREVRPLRDPGGNPAALRIPLEKTPAGGGDIQVTLLYGGEIESFASLRVRGFPFPKASGIPVALSQTQLHLPRGRRWFRFDGSMNLVEDPTRFEAGWLGYQTSLAERLAETLKSGDEYEKARATHNLERLNNKIDVTAQQVRRRSNDAQVQQQADTSEQILRDAQQQVAQSRQQEAVAVDGNRDSLNGFFETQTNSFGRNQVLLNVPNFTPDEIAPNPGQNQGKNAPSNYNDLRSGWASSNPAILSKSGVPTKGSLLEKSQIGQQGSRQQLAAEYLSRLDDNTEDYSADTGLAALFPQPDPQQYQTFPFSTPRGDMHITVWSLSEKTISAWGRFAACLVCGLLLLALFRRRRSRNRSRFLLFPALLGMAFGILPVFSFFLMLYALLSMFRQRHSRFG